jgi:hypothetical protein
MRTAFLLGALLLTGVVLAGPDEFRLVQVTVSVRDPAGLPVPGAQVRVYSEDWHLRFPRNLADGVTGGLGRCVVTVPVGRYSFFAGGPLAYTDSHPGQGLYVVQGPVEIRDSCEVVLQPDSVLRIRVTTRDGSPLSAGRLLACESSHVPVVYQPQVGSVRDGRIDLATSRGYRYHLVAHNLYEPGSVGYFLGAANVAVGADVVLRGDQAAKLAQVRVEVFDRNNQPGKAIVRFDFPELCIDGQYYAPDVSGGRDFRITPTLMSVLYEMRDERGSCFSLPRYLRLRAGQQTRIRLGGRIDPGSLSPLITTDFGYTEFLLDPKDAFGNHLLTAVDLKGKHELPLTVLENGQSVLRADLSNSGELWGTLAGYTKRVFEPQRDLAYALALDLYPLGQYTLRGRLVPNLTWQPTQAGSLHLRTPPGYPVQTAAFTDLTARIAAAQIETLGAEAPSPGVLPVWVKANALQAANGRAHVGALSLDEFLKLEPDALDPLLFGVLTHEIGHALQWAGDRANSGWYIGPAVEAEANLLALAARIKLFPERLAWYDTGEMLNWQILRRWESGEAIPPVFAQNLVQFHSLKRFGWAPHRRNHRIGWLRKGDYERLIGMVGLTKWEAMDAVLSHLCGEDLSWLYSVSGLTVDNRRVTSGVKLLAANRLSLGYPTPRVVLCGAPGEPVSVPFRLANNTETPTSVRLRLTPAPAGADERVVSLPGEGVAADQIEAGLMPRNAAELSLQANADGGLANRLTCTLYPAQPVALTDGSAKDTFPCLIPTRSGLLLAWQRGTDILVGRMGADGKLTATQTLAARSLYPRLLELSGGHVWLVYCGCDRGGTNNIFTRASADGGATWSDERQLTFEKPYVTCGPALAQDEAGAVWLACSNGLTISADGGETWSAPRPVPDIANGWFNLVPLSRNRMLALLGGESFALSLSGDGGATWPPFRTLDAYPRPSAKGTYPFPYLAKGASGRLHLVYNSDRGGNSLWYRSSADEGETWGDLVRLAVGDHVGAGSAVAEVGAQTWVVWAKLTDAGSQVMLSVLESAAISE